MVSSRPVWCPMLSRTVRLAPSMAATIRPAKSSAVSGAPFICAAPPHRFALHRHRRAWSATLHRRLDAMSQTVRGVISRKKGDPVELVDIVIPDPGPGEAVVDI